MLETALLALDTALLAALLIRMGTVVETVQRAAGSSAAENFRRATVEKLHEIAASVSSTKEWGPDLAAELDLRNRRRSNYRTATLGEGDMLRFHAGDTPNYSSEIRQLQSELQRELREVQTLLRQISLDISLSR